MAAWRAELELVAADMNQAVALHLRELVRQGAAVDAQVAGELLAVVRDREAAASGSRGLAGEVGEQLRADGLGAGVEGAPRELDVLACRERQEVLDELGVIGANT